jgi:hypothetical protein
LINLIKNEFLKIFKKKSIYIILLIIVAFVILINAMSKYAMNINIQYSQNETRDISSLNPDNLGDLQEYLSIRTHMDMEELKDEYGRDTWQEYIINTKMYEYIFNINRFTYGQEKNETFLAEAKEEYRQIIERLDNDDWSFFAEEELKDLRLMLEILKGEKGVTEERRALRELEDQIFRTEVEIKTIEMRLSNNIIYGNDYLNRALDSRLYLKEDIRRNEQIAEMTHEEKVEYNRNLEQLATAEYMIENQIDIHALNSRTILMSTFSGYDLFIVIIIVAIAGAIVGEEFGNGTVKLWLVRPHSRIKLLLAKYITILIMVIVSMVIILLMQFIIRRNILGV